MLLLASGPGLALEFPFKLLINRPIVQRMLCLSIFLSATLPRPFPLFASKTFSRSAASPTASSTSHHHHSPLTTTTTAGCSQDPLHFSLFNPSKGWLGWPILLAAYALHCSTSLQLSWNLSVDQIVIALPRIAEHCPPLPSVTTSGAAPPLVSTSLIRWSRRATRSSTAGRPGLLAHSKSPRLHPARRIHQLALSASCLPHSNLWLKRHCTSSLRHLTIVSYSLAVVVVVRLWMLSST